MLRSEAWIGGAVTRLARPGVVSAAAARGTRPRLAVFRLLQILTRLPENPLD